MKFTGRRLVLNDPRVVDKYISNVKRDVKHSRLHKKIENMRKRIVDGRQEECDEERMEILMEEIHNIMMEAEKNCRKLRMGNKEFSPELQAKRANVGFWQAAVKIKKGRARKGRKLRILAMMMEDEYKKDIRDVNLEQAKEMERKNE